MATKKVLVEINVEQKGNSIPNTTKEVDKLAKATERLAKEQSEEAIELAKVNYQIKQQQAANKLLAKEQIELANTVEHTTGAMQEMKTTSGLTGAIVTELGRTASDSAYGIRGMGNNISQLVTLFGQLSTNVTKAGGTMKDALNQVFQSMKGIIGIMTAIQVVLGLLQAEWFQKWLKGLFSVNKALQVNIDLMEAQSQIMGDSIGSFKVYTSLLKDANTTEEERVNIIKKLNEEYPDFNTNLLDNTENQKDQNEAVADYIRLLEVRARSEAAQSLFQEKEAEKVKLRGERIQELSGFGISTEEEAAQRLIEIEDTLFDFYEDFDKAQSAVFKQAVAARYNSVALQDEKDAIIKAFTINEDEIEEITKSQEFLLSQIDPESILSGKDGSRSRSSNSPLKSFRKGLLLLNKEEAGFLKERENLNRRTAEQIIIDEQEQREILIDIRLEEFKDSQKIRLDTYLSTKKLTDKQKEDAKRDYEESIELAEQEAEGVIRAIRSVADEKQKIREQDQELDKKERENRISELEKEIFLSRQVNVVDTAIQQGELDMLLLDNRRNLLEAELELETENTERKKELINQLALLEMQQQDQSYVNAENVSNAKLALATRGANVIADIIGKETAAGKTVAATAATVNTYQAVSNSLKYGTSPYKYVDAGITAAYGFQQVRNILNTDSPNTGSGGTGGSNVTVQPPDFNIVGSTGVNQLADAIGSTETPVVKAVVVASEVTTQQALDRNNRTNAEL